MDQTTQPPPEIEALRESLRALVGAGDAGTPVVEAIIDAAMTKLEALKNAQNRETERAEQAKKDREAAEKMMEEFIQNFTECSQNRRMEQEAHIAYREEEAKRIAYLEKRIHELVAMEQRLVTQIAQKQATLAQLGT